MSLPPFSNLLGGTAIASAGLAADALPKVIDAGKQLIEGLDFANLLQLGDQDAATTSTAIDSEAFTPLNQDGVSNEDLLRELKRIVSEIKQQLSSLSSLGSQQEVTLKSDGFDKLSVAGAAETRGTMEAALNAIPDSAQLLSQLFETVRRLPPAQVELETELSLENPSAFDAIYRGDESADLLDFSLTIQGDRLQARLD